jgi:outer membrane protein assembly factor BamA
MGTVDEGFSLSDWRVAAGFGLRINLEVFGGIAPMVFDFGFPLLDHDGDDVQVFQFSVGTSF